MAGDPMMRHFHRLMIAGFSVALIAAAVCSAPAMASRVVQPQVTGHVTAIAGSTISVDGHQYLIGAGSIAAQKVGTFHVGDLVGLVLNGPPTSSASQVILIQPIGGGQPAPSGP
jgi:hypothetical protein